MGQWDGKEWTYELPDGLGSVRQLADAQGYLVQRYDYAPFGEMLASEGKRTNSLRYTGEQWDSDIGLLYLRARWYDPSVGRFTTRDPLPGLAALPQTQHSYVYVGNNPINLTDPSGKFMFVPFLIAAGVGAAIGGIGAGIAYAVTHPCEGASSGFWRAVGVGAFSGGVAGLMSWAVPLFLPAAGGFWSVVGIGALSGSLAGGAGQVSVNVFTPGANPFAGVPEAMLVGGVTGGIAGGAGWKIRQWLATPSTVDHLRDAATQADNAIPGQGGAVGTRKHTVFQGIVDSWNDSRLKTEVSYRLGIEVRRGLPGSVRLDVVEYDAGRNITAVYDYKSGNAALSASRIANIQSHLPLNAQGVPIIEIRGR